MKRDFPAQKADDANRSIIISIHHSVSIDRSLLISKGKEKGEPGSPSPETPSVSLRDFIFTEEAYEAALSGVSEERFAASDSEELPS